MRCLIVGAFLAISCAKAISNPPQTTPVASASPAKPQTLAATKSCNEEDGLAACKSACDSGSQQSCAYVGIMFLQSEDYASAERYLTQACRAQIALGCGGLGSLYGVQGQRELSQEFMHKGCDMGDGLACESLGGMAQKIDRAQRPADAVEAFHSAIPYYRRACELGATRGCGWVAAAISDGIIAGSLQEALELGVKACNGRDTMPIACRHAADLFERNTPESRELAAKFDVQGLRRALLSRGCKLGDGQCCDLLSQVEKP